MRPPSALKGLFIKDKPPCTRFRKFICIPKMLWSGVAENGKGYSGSTIAVPLSLWKADGPAVGLGRPARFYCKE